MFGCRNSVQRGAVDRDEGGVGPGVVVRHHVRHTRALSFATHVLDVLLRQGPRVVVSTVLSGDASRTRCVYTVDC